MKYYYRNGVIRLLTKYPGFIILFLIQINLLSYSQLPGNDALTIHEKSFSEELYMSTDRDLYITGEKVWLKIYKLNGLTHTPVNLSKVAYIDLLDVDNNPVIELKINIDGFSSSGDFRLPDTLRTGNYLLRSYTNWMQNFSKDLFSYKIISVINPFEKIGDIKIPSPHQFPDSIIFCPEGGNLIAGIETRIGFKSFNKNGDPVSMSGDLIDENNDTISQIKTENNGYGWARVKPAGQNKIFLTLTDKNGQTRKFQLPVVQDEGIILSVAHKNESSPILVKIKMSPYFNPAGHNLFIVMNAAGLTSIKKEIKIEKDHEIDILRKDLPHGLSHLMIIDENNKLMAYRWIYNEPDQSIKYKISIQNNPNSLREKIKVGISATDNIGTSVESDFSVSVVKAVTINKKSFNNNIYRQLPEFAAINTDTYSPEVNDYLIFFTPHELNFNQDENNYNGTPIYIPELEGHLIKGNIRDRRSGEPLRNENITLSFVGKNALCQFTKTDNNGDFIFVTTEYGLREIVIRPLSSEIEDCYVELNNPFTSTFINYSFGSFYIDSSKLGELNNAIISMQINNIYEPFYQHAVKKEKHPERHNFYGKPDNTIEMSNYIELTSVKEIVKELLPGVLMTRSNDNIHFKLVKNQTMPFENDPLVLVDGVPVYDLEKVLNIDSRDMEKVDVLISKYFISDIVLDGILHFVTKRGNLGVYDMDKSVFRQEYEFMQNKNEFYSPDYSLDSLKNNHLPDFRNTLYWNPYLRTDKTGKTDIEFYSSDESGEYTIRVEGITSDGKTGTASIPLIVNAR